MFCVVLSLCQDVRLSYDEVSGLGMVHTGEEVVWANDLLQDVIFQDPVSHRCVVMSKGTHELAVLAEWLAKHQECEVNVQIPGTTQHSSIAAYLMTRASDGCSVFWSLCSLHAKLGFDSGRANNWYHKHWGAWVKYAETKFLLSPIHCRRAQVV